MTTQHPDIQQLLDHRIPRYGDLPTFGLYMDQVVSYVNEHVSPYYMVDEKLLTTSMVNNYVKQGVIPKPEKKKYARHHIAYLIVICLLKKVFSIPEITQLIAIQTEAFTTQRAYDSFMGDLEQSIKSVFGDEGLESAGEGNVTDKHLLLQGVVRTFSNKIYTQKRIEHEDVGSPMPPASKA